MRLRQIVDERYTASSLLGLSQNYVADPITSALLPSTSICGNYYSKIVTENQWLLGDEPSSLVLNAIEINSATCPQQTKRVRMRGKYTPQEREKIRF
jgi:hypothetical protein